jgi:excisionase family DNA binding protein
MSPPTPITLQEAADRLGVHYMTAYRYVRTGRLPATREGVEWRVDPADVARLRRPTTRPAPRGARGDATRRLEQRMLAGDVAGAWAVVEGALTSGASPAEIYLRVLAPALGSIGERWAAGDLSVADEHRATVVAQRIVGQLGPRFARRGRTRGTVVIGAPAGERHALPSAMLADLLRDAGFAVVDLGADAPPESFADAAASAPRLVAVCIGISRDGLADAMKATVRALEDAGVDAPIVIGGAAVTDADEARRLGATHWSGGGAAAAVATIDGLAASPRRASG